MPTPVKYYVPLYGVDRTEWLELTINHAPDTRTDYERCRDWLAAAWREYKRRVNMATRVLNGERFYDDYE